MLTDLEFLENGLVAIKLSGRLTQASAVHNFTDMIRQCHRQGRRGILLDLSRVQKVNMAGLAALVELMARFPKADIGFCGLPTRPLEFLRKSGLDRGLQIFASIEDALRHPTFRAHTLSGVRAVLLCAGKGTRVAPLTEVFPKPLLDLAGRPTMHRIIDHLHQFGVRDIFLNPGHLGEQVIDYFRSALMPDTHITFVNEGGKDNGAWTARPIGSASTLKRMQERNSAFDDDIIVLCGDALIDLDLSEMMKQHRASGADATIAALTVAEEDVHKYGIIEAAPTGTVTRFVEKPGPGVTESRLANSGIYIFSPRVLDLLSDAEQLDIACDLLPAIMASGGKIHVYDTPFSWVDIGCGRDYAQAMRKCLSRSVPFAPPIGQEVRPGVWAMQGVDISPAAEISGPCHIGEGARIEAGARLDGVCSIGAGAVIESGTLLSDCIVMPHTNVAAGAWAQNMILHADWAIDHTLADGSQQERGQLDRVGPVEVLIEHAVPKQA